MMNPNVVSRSVDFKVRKSEMGQGVVFRPVEKVDLSDIAIRKSKNDEKIEQ